MRGLLPRHSTVRQIACATNAPCSPSSLVRSRRHRAAATNAHRTHLPPLIVAPCVVPSRRHRGPYRHSTVDCGPVRGGEQKAPRPIAALNCASDPIARPCHALPSLAGPPPWIVARARSRRHEATYRHSTVVLEQTQRAEDERVGCHKWWRTRYWGGLWNSTRNYCQRCSSRSSTNSSK